MALVDNTPRKARVSLSVASILRRVRKMLPVRVLSLRDVDARTRADCGFPAPPQDAFYRQFSERGLR